MKSVPNRQKRNASRPKRSADRPRQNASRPKRNANRPKNAHLWRNRKSCACETSWRACVQVYIDPLADRCCFFGLTIAANTCVTGFFCAEKRLTMPSLTLTVNGVQHMLDVPANRFLAEVLRYDLGLTGAKIGCNEAECGACMVHVNGKSVNSCIFPAFKAQGAHVLTIEGLADE